MVEISNGPGGDGQGRSGLRARPTRAARSAGEPGPRVRDSRVLDRLAAGDEQALAELYDGYARTAYSLAQRICRDEHLAETVVVTVFRTLWQAPTDLPPRRAAFSTWLLSTVHQQAVDTVRRAGIPRPVPDVLLAEITGGPSAGTAASTPTATGPAVGDSVRRDRRAACGAGPNDHPGLLRGLHPTPGRRHPRHTPGTVRRRMVAAVHQLRGALGPVAGTSGLAGPNPNAHAASSGPEL